ncbi:restriction endonuclease subunit S [Rasiella sp. SM2506]|uniref:restriction endonuclease subunit S n=1 Tax=Rasiella sp. SM2506 TaxID=3423914 RepID=UPI003D7A48D1
MKQKLKHIATITSGFSFRGKITPDIGGTVRVIQLKNVQDNLTIDDACICLDSKKIKPQYLLSQNEVLFMAKGANNFALVPDLSAQHPTIASAVFFVISVNPKMAHPDYVAWQINQTRAQNHFKSLAAGTYQTNINREVLENTPILLPSLEKQELIAKIITLKKKEEILTAGIQEYKTNLITATIYKSIKK